MDCARSHRRLPGADDDRHTGGHRARGLRLRRRLPRFRFDAVLAAAGAPVRRGDQLHHAGDSAVRLHGRDAGEIPRRRGHARDHRPRHGRAQRRHGHRHHPGRRADGCLDRHRRRHRGHGRNAHPAHPDASRLQAQHRLRHDLRIRHAGPDHPAQPGADPARRDRWRVRRHAVCRSVHSRPRAGTDLRHLPARGRQAASVVGTGDSRRRTRAGRPRHARARPRPLGRTTAAAGGRRTGLHHRRHCRADRGGLDGCAGQCADRAVRTAHELEADQRDPARHAHHHRHGVLHPAVRTALLAGLPWARRRTDGARPLQPAAWRRTGCPDLPDGPAVRARLLPGVDRDLLHRTADVPAGVPAPTWYGWPPWWR